MIHMYMDDYKRWAAAELEDPALTAELQKIEGQDEEIKDRFAVALKFGTAGLRGVLGAGTNRMNIYVVRQATQGLANWVKTQGGNQLVAVSYDSRINSDVFAKETAKVLAANGIKVRIYDALMPVPALSFATRFYGANAGVMITASHNPANYNGIKLIVEEGRDAPVETTARLEKFIEENEKIESDGLVEIYSRYISDETEIGTLARSYTDLINFNNNYIENIREIEGEKERIKAELNIAYRIQAANLPKEGIFNEYYSVNGYSQPAKEVGGDFFDYYQIDDSNLALVIGDASGKGVPAALLSMITQVMVKQILNHDKNPSKVLYLLNNTPSVDV